MYYRVYPSKNNTIFKYIASDGVTDVDWSKTINTGQSSIMEIKDGAGQSKIILGFNFSDEINTKLLTYPFTASLKLFDAGSLYDTPLDLKDIALDFFYDDFSEGDGWSFNQPSAIAQSSNWVYRLDGIPWDFTQFQRLTDQYLNSRNQDFVFDVTSAVSQSLSQGTNINFALYVSSPAYDLNVKSKLIYSKYTRTILQPYIEIIIQDEINDNCYNLVAGDNNQIFFINENGRDFSGAITANVTLNNNTIVPLTSTKVVDGVYYIVVNPSEPMYANKKEFVIIVWQIDGIDYYKQTIQVNPHNQLSQGIDYKNLYFYPSTAYTHNQIRQGDIIPFDVISQIRGIGDVIDVYYQYKIVTSDGFEIVPWMPVNVYRDRLYFYVDTSYFFPEQSYEVILRDSRPDFTISSNLTYKFKLVQDAQSQQRDLNATPYYPRESFFSK